MDKGMVAKRGMGMGTDEPNGVRPVWLLQRRPGRAGPLAAASRRRWLSFLQLLWFILLVSRTRGTVGDRVCSDFSEAFLDETCEVFPLEPRGELVRCEFVVAKPRELMDEFAFL